MTACEILSTSSITWLIERLTLLLLLTLFAFPHIAVAEPSVDVINPAQGNYDVVEPVRELPYSIRSNCWNYVRSVYPQTPSTNTVKANLSTEGEIGYLLYGAIEHYVVVTHDDGVNVTFSETHFYGDTYSVRTLPKSRFSGFFNL